MLTDEQGGLMPRSPSSRGACAGARAKSPEKDSADWWKCMNHLVLPRLLLLPLLLLLHLLHEPLGASLAAVAPSAVAVLPAAVAPSAAVLPRLLLTIDRV